MIHKIIFVLAIFWMLMGPLSAQEDTVLVREKVETLNVEVPVRVYAGGKPVCDLKKEDFTLYENGKIQEINGFYFSRKKIGFPPESEEKANKTVLSRYFILAFSVHDFNEPLRKGLVHVFDKILRAEDQLLVFINNQTRLYVQLHEKERIRTEIEADLKNQCHIAKNHMLISLGKLESEANDLLSILQDRNMTLTGHASHISFFLERYKSIWNEYKERHSSQEIDSYYNLAKHLAKIKKEKWVINFYQLEMFPRLSTKKRIGQMVKSDIDAFRSLQSPEAQAHSNSLSRALAEIDRMMDMGDFSTTEIISKLFSKVNATFHSIFIKTNFETSTENFEALPTVVDLENNLRELTKKTGGNLITSNDIVTSLDTISATEDNLYMLTYEPPNPKKIGKIKVVLAQKGYEVLYDDNRRADYIVDYFKKKELEDPSIMLKNMSFREKKLFFELTQFRMQSISGKSCGHLSVHVQVVSPLRQSVFDQSRRLEAQNDPVSLSLGYNFLLPGKYDVIVEVQDLLSGKSYTDFLQTEIN
jgi:VWFA-related protein